MAWFLASILYSSILGMGLILVLKRWELRTGNMIFASVRPHARHYFHTGVVFFARTLPLHASSLWATVYRWLRSYAGNALAGMLLWLEQSLERTLSFLRHSEAPRDGTAAPSAFLQEVAEHKKNLARRKTRRIEEE